MRAAAAALAQLDAPGQHPQLELGLMALIVASLVPLARDVAPRDAQLGPFSAAAEMVNGACVLRRPPRVCVGGGGARRELSAAVCAQVAWRCLRWPGSR